MRRNWRIDGPTVLKLNRYTNEVSQYREPAQPKIKGHRSRGQNIWKCTRVANSHNNDKLYKSKGQARSRDPNKWTYLP